MSHDKDTSSVRAQLGKTSSMLGQIKCQHDEITRGATARLEQVTKRLQELRPKAILERDAANEYMELTKEKGALLRTLQ